MVLTIGSEVKKLKLDGLKADPRKVYPPITQQTATLCLKPFCQPHCCQGKFTLMCVFNKIYTFEAVSIKAFVQDSRQLTPDEFILSVNAVSKFPIVNVKTDQLHCTIFKEIIL